jgi:hypothetical protein
MKNFKEYINSIAAPVVEETTSADIAKVDSKLGGKVPVVKRPKDKLKEPETDEEGRDDEVEDSDEEKEKEHYEDLDPNNIKSAAVKKQLKNGDRT